MAAAWSKLVVGQVNVVYRSLPEAPETESSVPSVDLYLTLFVCMYTPCKYLI